MEKPKQFRPYRLNNEKKFNGRAHIDAMYATGEWAEYRTRFLKDNPRCYSCGEISTVVDHITPHKGDLLLFEKLDNHLPLCVRCHNYITAKFDYCYKAGDSIEPKLKWVSQNRNRNEVTTRVKVLPYYKKG